MSTIHEGPARHLAPSGQQQARTRLRHGASAPGRWLRRFGRKARVAIVGGATLIMVAAIGATGVALAGTLGLPHYEVWVQIDVHSNDYDELSANEKCDDFPYVRIADLFPDDSTRQVDGREYRSPDCGDRVTPVATLTASLHPDGVAHIVGTLKMDSEFCGFSGTVDPCQTQGTGVFTITEFEVDLQPGGSFDVCPTTCTGEHLNRVEYHKFRIDYSTLSSGPTD